MQSSCYVPSAHTYPKRTSLNTIMGCSGERWVRVTSAAQRAREGRGRGLVVTKVGLAEEGGSNRQSDKHSVLYRWHYAKAAVRDVALQDRVLSGRAPLVDSLLRESNRGARSAPQRTLDNTAKYWLQDEAKLRSETLKLDLRLHLKALVWPHIVPLLPLRHKLVCCARSTVYRAR